MKLQNNEKQIFFSVMSIFFKGHDFDKKAAKKATYVKIQKRSILNSIVITKGDSRNVSFFDLKYAIFISLKIHRLI